MLLRQPLPGVCAASGAHAGCSAAVHSVHPVSGDLSSFLSRAEGIRPDSRRPRTCPRGWGGGRIVRREMHRAGSGGPQRKPLCPAGARTANQKPPCTRMSPNTTETRTLRGWCPSLDRTPSLPSFQGKPGPTRDRTSTEGGGGGDEGTPVVPWHGPGGTPRRHATYGLGPRSQTAHQNPSSPVYLKRQLP